MKNGVKQITISNINTGRSWNFIILRWYTNDVSFNIVLTGSSFIHKYLYNNSIKLLKTPNTTCIDTWIQDKTKYVIRIKFKRVS